MAPKAKGESNRGLIVTLVFFILATIGGGLGTYYGYAEVEKLVRDLLDCDLPYCCPHGRPTMIQISLAELERKFGRKA